MDNTFPLGFVAWYWTHFAEGHESPSYQRKDSFAEYGCSQSEFLETDSESLIPELNTWLLENRSQSELDQLVDNYLIVKKTEFDVLLKTYENYKNRKPHLVIDNPQK